MTLFRTSFAIPRVPSPVCTTVCRIMACALGLAGAVVSGQTIEPRQELQRLTEQLEEQQKQIEALQAALSDQTEAVRALRAKLLSSEEERTQNPTEPQPVANPPTAIGDERFYLKAGGFMEATAMVRSRNQNADVGETFGNIPLDGTANAALSSFRMSSRHSRLSLLAKAQFDKVTATGYFEGDFLGSSTSANEVESNDFPLRVRQFWGDAEFASGLSFTAGQTWTLLTTHQRGLRPLDEYLTLALSAQHVVGFNWARQTGFRVTKDFGGGIWAAAALENPETHTGGVVLPIGAFGLSSSPNARVPAATFASSLTPGANGISTDLAPDIVGKIVFEPGWGHYEIKGIGRWFRSRFDERNTAALGGGVGGAALLPVSKELDLLFEVLAGRGIGRYAAAVGPDVAIGPEGSVHPIRAVQAITGFDWKPTKALQIYNYIGLEFYGRTSFSGSTVGYGSPLLDLAPCASQEGFPCAGGNRSIWQIMPGIWYSLARSEHGSVALGLSYIHTRRALWSGLESIRPEGQENSFVSSIRYYLP